MIFNIHWGLFKCGDMDPATFDDGRPIEIIAEKGPEARTELKKKLLDVGAELLKYNTIPPGRDDEGENPFHAWSYTVKIRYAGKEASYLFLVRGMGRNPQRELRDLGSM